MEMFLISLTSIFFKVTDQKSVPTFSSYWKECCGLVPQNGCQAVAMNGHMTCDISVDSPMDAEAFSIGYEDKVCIFWASGYGIQLKESPWNV